MAISIIDVAKRSGFSKTTVSAVVNGKDCVKDSTKQAILQAIKELDYHPNLSARELITSNKTMLGILLPTYERSSIPSHEMYFPYINEGSNYEIVSGILDSLSRTKYGVLTEHLAVDTDSPKLPAFALSQRVQGAILISPLYKKEYLQTLQKYVPYLVQIGAETDICDCIYTDFTLTVSKSVDYLFDRGHRRIAFLNADPISDTAKYRLAGYKAGLSKHGIAFDKSLVRSAPFTALNGYLAIQDIWSSTQVKPTAFICPMADSACGAMRYLNEQGLRVPDDLSIVVNGNGLPCELAIPTLTVIGRDKSEVADEAAKMLLWRIQNPKEPLRKVVLRDYLIERNSVKRI